MKLLLLFSFLSLCGCQFFDGLNQFRSGQNSVPAYPPGTEDFVVYWHEEGHVWRFDKNGGRQIK